MRLKCFSIPALDPDASTEQISTFLAGHRILTIDRQLVDDGAASYWAICVTYQSGEPSDAASAAKRPKLDYREVLSDEDFAVFAKLRNLRKQISDRENVPPYALFTNEHLATMVRDRVHDAKALRAISGVGQARVDKYGDAFLGLLRREQSVPPTPEQADATP